MPDHFGKLLVSEAFVPESNNECFRDLYRVSEVYRSGWVKATEVGRIRMTAEGTLISFTPETHGYWFKLRSCSGWSAVRDPAGNEFQKRFVEDGSLFYRTEVHHDNNSIHRFNFYEIEESILDWCGYSLEDSDAED